MHKTYGIFSSPVTKKSAKPMGKLGVFCNLSRRQVVIFSCKLRNTKVSRKFDTYVPGAFPSQTPLLPRPSLAEVCLVILLNDRL